LRHLHEAARDDAAWRQARDGDAVKFDPAAARLDDALKVRSSVVLPAPLPPSSATT
jgi:hypothetical protein